MPKKYRPGLRQVKSSVWVFNACNSIRLAICRRLGCGSLTAKHLFLGHASWVGLKGDHLHDPWSSRGEGSGSVIAADSRNHPVLGDVAIRRSDDAPGKARAGA